VNSTKRRNLAGVGLAAAAVALSGAALYTSQAGAQTGRRASLEPGQPVNTPSPAPTGVAPVSFADIVQRVAPAVVSIDIEGKMGPRRTAYNAPQDGPDADDGDDGQGQDNPFGFDMRRLFPRGFPGQGGPSDPAQSQPMEATGSGFFISPDGYIVTNNHVVENADTITVRTNDDRKLKARLIGRDPATDLAVIKVEGERFPYVSFEDRGKPRVGDWVVAVGNPFNLGGTATAGIVSALARPNISGSSYVDYMQIDAPINRGNSGGPSFDLNGRVVGVNSAIFSPSGGSVGIGFDIPADVAEHITRELISNGKIVRGYIGATVQPVTDEIAESLGVKSTDGALVADLTPGGPAARAGLQTGDLVTRINGAAVKSNSDLTRRVGQVRVGEEVRLTVLRDGRTQEITVRAGERPSEESLARNDRRAGPQR
jgi:serine protease Do